MSARNIIELRDLFVDVPDSYEMFVERAGQRLGMQIREMRGRAGLKQMALANFCTELADKYGAENGRINQPYIAQLENGEGNPSLYKVLWVLWCLELAHRGDIRLHQDYCRIHMISWKDIRWARMDERARDVIKRMRDENISQVPVVDRDVDTKNTMVRYDAVRGTITEIELLAADMENDSTLIGDLALRSKFPKVEPHCGRGSLVNMFRMEPVALVVDKRGRIMGLITPMDIL